MAPRRKATLVRLTPSQRDRLERIWFVYGNYGPKTTRGNHSFIQGLLEHGTDTRPLITNRTPKYQRPTEECVAAVDKILSDPDGANYTPPGLRMLTLIKASGDGQRPPSPGSELKALLKEISRNQTTATTYASSEDETPDAA